MKRAALYVLPIVAWAATLFYLSSQSKLPAPHVNHFDKVMHASAYAVFGALSARAFLGYGATPRLAIVLGLALASAYGATDEIHQMFTPGRSPDVADWIADTLGAAAGAAFWVKVVARKGAVS